MTTFRASGKGSQNNGAASFGIACAINAGDSVVVVGSWAAGSTVTPSVVTTGGAGSDTAVLIYGPFTSGTFKYAAWLIQSASAARTGVTLSWSGSNPSFADAYCESFFGLVTPTLDKVAFASGSGAAVNSGSTGLLSSASDFAIAYAASVNAITSVNAPWTSDGITSLTSSGGEHQVLASNAAVSSNFSNSGGAWISFVLTFSGIVAALASSFVPTKRQYLRAAATPPPPGVPVVSPASFTVPANPTQDQLVGMISATNSPTSYAITAGDAPHNFDIWPSANLRTVQSGTPPPAGNYSLSVTATNAAGTSAPATISITVQAVVSGGTIPLTYNDARFNDNTNSSNVTVANGGTVSNKSITDTGPVASIVTGNGATIQNCRVNSRECVRIGGGGTWVIDGCYLEATGISGDHADVIQAYAPGSSGNVTITNTALVAHNQDATAGLWVADGYSGTFTLNNVAFIGGPYGLRLAADTNPINISLTDVFFVGPFGFGAFLFQPVGAPINVTKWQNVRNATIVNGVLVPGALIPSP